MPRAQREESDVRTDPKPRHIDGTSPWLRLQNRDPSRHYVYVAEQNGGNHDVQYYASLSEGLGLSEHDGYVIEQYREGGVKPSGGKTGNPGEPIKFRSTMLMSCPVDFKKLLDQVGSDGASGQDAADKQDKLYRRTGSYWNGVNQISQPGISLKKATQEAGWNEE